MNKDCYYYYYYIVFHKAKIKTDSDVDTKMNNNRLKYLGVIIDHRMNWTQHIDHINNKVS